MLAILLNCCMRATHIVLIVRGTNESRLYLLVRTLLPSNGSMFYWVMLRPLKLKEYGSGILGRSFKQGQHEAILYYYSSHLMEVMILSQNVISSDFGMVRA